MGGGGEDRAKRGEEEERGNRGNGGGGGECGERGEKSERGEEECGGGGEWRERGWISALISSLPLILICFTRVSDGGGERGKGQDQHSASERPWYPSNPQDTNSPAKEMQTNPRSCEAFFPPSPSVPYNRI